MINFNVEKIKFITKKNGHLIFLIENFLKESDYKNIKRNIPNIDLSKVDPVLMVNRKLGISPSDEIYENVILKNDVLNKLHNSVFNINFLQLIFKKFFAEIIYSRKNDFSYLIKLLIRINRFTINPKQKNFLQKIFFNYIFPTIQYSYMYNKSKIVPHTDSRGKLISLMLYFPDDDLTHSEIEALGTSFYESSIKNLNNKHIGDNKDENKFKINSKKICTLPFVGKNLYGFIRTDRSWHTVEPIIKNENFIRKSININLLFN
jgi:hypothetical protein